MSARVEDAEEVDVDDDEPLRLGFDQRRFEQRRLAVPAGSGQACVVGRPGRGADPVELAPPVDQIVPSDRRAVVERVDAFAHHDLSVEFSSPFQERICTF
jgi:hypothetical protein